MPTTLVAVTSTTNDVPMATSDNSYLRDLHGEFVFFFIFFFSLLNNDLQLGNENDYKDEWPPLHTIIINEWGVGTQRCAQVFFFSSFFIY